MVKLKHQSRREYVRHFVLGFQAPKWHEKFNHFIVFNMFLPELKVNVALCMLIKFHDPIP